MNNTQQTATEAVIYLKNGERKYGILFIENFIKENVYRFISNTNLNLFKATNNPEYIENVSAIAIESIDIDLK
jgi:hypothetical protein